MIIGVVTANGEIAHVYAVADENAGDLPENAHVLPCSLAEMASYGERHYWKHGAWQQREPRDRALYLWDNSQEHWVANISGAIQCKTREIEKVRQHRNTLPVLFDGKRLDADATAQKNLADKLAGVKERIRLGVGMDPALMVWKDADNIVHIWADLQTYCDWLAGYVIALEDRGTRLYAAAWQHKSNLGQLTDIDLILNYDINSNWPE